MKNLDWQKPHEFMMRKAMPFRIAVRFLYGSRARGQITPTSDYDVVGVCKSGNKTRISKKVDGKFWDVFVYSEKDLKMLSDRHLSRKNARILYSRGSFIREKLAQTQGGL